MKSDEVMMTADGVLFKDGSLGSFKLRTKDWIGGPIVCCIALAASIFIPELFWMSFFALCTFSCFFVFMKMTPGLRYSSGFRVFEDRIEVPGIPKEGVEDDPVSQIPLSKIAFVYPSSISDFKDSVWFTIGFLLTDGHRRIHTFTDSKKALNKELEKSRGHACLVVLKSVFGDRWDDVYLDHSPFSKYYYRFDEEGVEGESGKGISDSEKENGDPEISDPEVPNERHEILNDDDILSIKKWAETIEQQYQGYELGNEKYVAPFIMLFMVLTASSYFAATESRSAGENFFVIGGAFCLLIFGLIFGLGKKVKQEELEKDWGELRPRFREALIQEDRTGERILPDELRVTKLYEQETKFI